MDFMAFLLLSLVALIFKPHRFVATMVVFQDGEKVNVVSAAAQKGSQQASSSSEETLSSQTPTPALTF